MRLLAPAFACVALLAGCAGAPPQPTDEPTRAKALFDAYWEEASRLYPENATRQGDYRFDDKLTDQSPAGIAAEDAWWRSVQARAHAIDPTQLTRTDALSVELLEATAERVVALQPFTGYRSMDLTAAPFAFQGSFAGLVRAMPTETTAQMELLFVRMAAWSTRVNQEIARARQGMAAGWVPSRAVLERVIGQLDSQLTAVPEQSPFYEPFTRLGRGIPAATQDALRARGLRALAEDVLPAQQRLRDFVAGDYLRAAPAEGGLTRYPGGDKVYAALVRTYTTTSLAPAQVHEIGLREVARIRKEMEAVHRESRFDGSFDAFVDWLNNDPRFFYSSPEELLDGYRQVAKRIDPELPRLFAELPRTPYGIRAMPEFLGPGAPEHYSSPALDGTTAGWFNANTVGFKSRPKWAMEVLVAHEAVPGHHLQIARASELKGLPEFRRSVDVNAYLEGWALYSESLGPELGLYQNPYSRFGFLQAQMWRAVRLVVDTGIHLHGWTRSQAIDYMRERSGLNEVRVAGEVDRYISWPGQALGYMVGQLKITELRDRAQKALGPRFDLRRFHMVLLDSGPLPLNILEREVEQWIQSQK